MAETRRITAKDFDEVEAFINDEMQSRESNNFRKDVEPIWKEVDRQIRMKAPQRVSIDGKKIPATWHNEFELGELAKASEIITADVMRMLFPEDRTWFEPHVQVPGMVDPQTGRESVQADLQETADDQLRALMSQQHLDFGLKPRFELSVKESLHHGSFAGEVRWDAQMMSREGRVKEVGAPVWVPYSMWNTFPDPSPSVIGTNLFYSGSMILVEFMPFWKLKKIAKGDGWIPKRLEQVQEKSTHNLESAEGAETSDVKLVKFFGDLHISRKKDDGIFLPNCKAILANGKLVFVQANDDLPYPPIIFAGYERMDVRNPYYTSPIIKNSPIQKFTTIMLNRFADVADLWGDPPIEYDANDADYVMNGGPRIAPGAKTPTRSIGKGMTALKVGDPTPLMNAGQFGVRMLEQGTGVSALRQGTPSSSRQTATEINSLEQGAEVRTVDFVSKLGPSALRPFLYMQHEFNRRRLKDYPAYVNEMNSADYMIFSRKEVDIDASFDVVGARSMLGEERRKQQMTQVTFAAAGNPLFAPILNPQRILLDMYRDAGKKNPEEWVQNAGPQIPPQVQAQMQQLQQLAQQLAQENKDLKSGQQLKMAQLQSDHQQAMAQLQHDEKFAAIEAKQKEREIDIKAATLKVDAMLRKLELRQDAVESALGNQLEFAKVQLDEKSTRVDQAIKAASAIKPPKVVKPKRKKKFDYDTQGNVIRIREIEDPSFVPPEGAFVIPPIDKAVKYSPDGDVLELEDL